MSIIITLAALWILRYPIIILLCFVFSVVMWPIRMIDELFEVENVILSMVIFGGIVGVSVYLNL